MPGPVPRKVNCRGCSNRGQAGLLHLRAVGRISTFPQCRQDGATNRLAVMPKCGGSVLRPSRKLCIPSHAVPKAPITQEDTSYHPQRSPRNGGPWHSPVSTRNSHRVISRGKTKERQSFTLTVCSAWPLPKVQTVQYEGTNDSSSYHPLFPSHHISNLGVQ